MRVSLSAALRRGKAVAELIPKGTWVGIYRVVLTPIQRAPDIPEDTERVPLEMRVKGFLVAAASVGEEVDVVTATGRRLRGTLEEVNPAYSHGFGSPIPELSAIAGEVRKLLRERGGSR
jgi:2-amino-4-ketopentanoate thiolase alpha subunit